MDQLMKLAHAKVPVETNIGSSQAFTIANSSKMFSILADKIYSDKPRAVVREICCNALDIHRLIGQTKPFFVSMPSMLEPMFQVRDFGTGLSHDQVLGLYTTFFDSSKSDDNGQVGGFGLGSKSPFAYTDAFTVTAYQDGRARIYAAFRGSDGIPQISLVADEPSDEEAGLEVKVPVHERDISRFIQVGQDVLRWFPEGSFRTFGFEVNPVRKTVENDLYIMTDQLSYNYVLMGPVAYRVDWDQVGADLPKSIVPIFEVGELDLPPSREQLSYDEMTKKALRDRFDAIAVRYAEDVLERADSMTRLERLQLLQELKQNHHLGKMFEAYHKGAGHRDEDTAARDVWKAANPDRSHFDFKPKWGRYLLWEHEEVVTPGHFRIHHLASGRSKRTWEKHGSHYSKLVITEPYQFNEYTFVLMDVPGTTPRIAERIEGIQHSHNSREKLALYSPNEQVQTVDDLRALLPEIDPSRFLKLSDYQPLKKAKVRPNTVIWQSRVGYGNTWYKESGVWDEGIYVPFVHNDPAYSQCKYGTWAQLLETRLAKQIEILGLTETARKRLKGGTFIRLDDWLHQQAKAELAKPDIKKALSAAWVYAQVKDDPMFQFLEERAKEGLTNILPGPVAKVRALLDDMQIADATSLHQFAKLGLIKIPDKYRDIHGVIKTVQRTKERNDLLLWVLAIGRYDVSATGDNDAQLERIVK